MSFPFHSDTKQKLAFPPQTEQISIGCEAWIDVSRFCAAQKPGDPDIAGDDSRSVTSSSSLTKSFADFRRKFRNDLDEDIG